MIICRVELENSYMGAYYDFKDSEAAMEFAKVAVLTASKDKKATIIVMEEPKDEEETDSDK